ncbi:hypothetical protein FRA_27c02490 [Francisella sp. W12-1067]|nr:hypothetical protein FRA_27c02490 [Francisella sp. W12-1067]
MGIGKDTVTRTLKKKANISRVNFNLLSNTDEVILIPYMELDEQWSFVQNKNQQRWLWLAICHTTSKSSSILFW